MTGRIVWPAWFEGAPCAGQTDVFFPEDQLDTDGAKRVCAACPHRVACLEWGLAHPGWAGIYGGLTYAERRGLRRDRGLDRHLSTRCRQGHEFTAANTGFDASGSRRCLTCKRETADRSHERRALRRVP